MDPLSITASAIALGGLAATIGKGIKTLKSLGKIPDEFCALLNELTMLQLVAQELDSIPSNHYSTTELDILRQDLVQTVKKLQDLASRFETSGKGLDSRGRHRIPRIQWTRERSNIESLREQARRTRDYISAYLATVNMSESFNQSSLLLDIRGITRLASDNLIASVDQGARNESRLGRIENRLESIASLQAEALYYHRARDMADQQQTSHLTEDFQVSGSTASGLESKSGALTPVSHDGPTSRDSILCLQAALRCRLTCRCRCHKSTNLQTHPYLRRVVGAFFLSYNTAVTFGSGACNYAGCNASSTRRLQFCYYLPSWIASCAVQFSASWGSLRDRGATLSLKVPRVISSNDNIWLAIEIRDIEYIQEMFSTKRNSPTDVEEGTGGSLIASAVACGYLDLIKLLLQEGCDVSAQSITGGMSAESRAKEHLLIGCVADEALLMYERIVEMGANDHISTGIHDSILGINDVGIEKAIEMEPDSLDSWDSTRNTPLHWAARLGKSPALEALIHAGANVAAPNSWLRTPLHTAARCGNLAAVQQLLDAGSDPNARDFGGQTPLHDALVTDPTDSYPDSADVVKLLLRYGADANAIDTTDKRSPLNYYAYGVERYSEAVDRNVDALLMAGADIDQVNGYGCTPLLECIPGYNSSSPHMFRVLYSRGARLDVVDHATRLSVLHRIALWGTLDLIAYLRGLPTLDLDTECKDIYGNTALQWMVWRTRAATKELGVGIRKPTQEEVDAFGLLVREIQERRQRDRILEDSLELRRVQTGEGERESETGIQTLLP